MGVPKFFRWLSERYPRINQPITRHPKGLGGIDNPGEVVNDNDISISGSVEAAQYGTADESLAINECSMSPGISNVYVDLNGILHGCAHNNANQNNLDDGSDESDIRLLTEEKMTNAEIMKHVEVYLDRIIDIANPTSLIYIAVDGVAPRAKLNQQRARRFKASAEDSLSEQYEANRNNAGTLSGTIVAELDMEKANSMEKYGDDGNSNEFYSTNAITPGTQFMEDVTKCIEQIIDKRLKNKAWGENVDVVFSGSNVPGEGEHKIMNYIRSLPYPDSGNNGRHCIVGQDGDLIMLGLMTKFRNLCLLREHVNFRTMRELLEQPSITTREGINAYVQNSKFEFLHIAILRDYIAIEFDCAHDSASFNNDDEANTKKYDLNRTIDDILFLFLFIGNDFLPNIPSIDIGDGGLDILLEVYKDSRGQWSQPHLTKNGKILDYGQLSSFFKDVQNLLYSAKGNEWKGHLVGSHSAEEESNHTSAGSGDGSSLLNKFQSMFLNSLALFQPDDETSNSTRRISGQNNQDLLPSNRKKLAKVPIKQLEKVYYTTKFPPKTNPDDISQAYFQTIQWVFDYYYRGVEQAGWGHYYCYHYGPMLHTLTNFTSKLAGSDPEAQLHENSKDERPLPPVLQLLGCLPPSSAHLLPTNLQHILLDDANGYYPTAFQVDLNGKRNHWESTILLPFIDANDLRQIVGEDYKDTGGNAWIYRNGEKRSIFCDEDGVSGVGFRGDINTTLPEHHLYPTLVPPHTLAPVPQKAKLGLNIFGTRSRYPTLLLHLSNHSMSMLPPITALASNLIGSVITYNYPYVAEGFVTALSDSTWNIRGKVVTPVMEGHESWLERIRRDMERGKGTVGTGGLSMASGTGVEDFIVSIRPLKGLVDFDGVIKKEYADFEIQVPLSYCLQGDYDGANGMSCYPVHSGKDPFLLDDEARKVREAIQVASIAADKALDEYNGSAGMGGSNYLPGLKKKGTNFSKKHNRPKHNNGSGRNKLKRARGKSKSRHPSRSKGKAGMVLTTKTSGNAGKMSIPSPIQLPPSSIKGALTVQGRSVLPPPVKIPSKSYHSVAVAATRSSKSVIGSMSVGAAALSVLACRQVK